MPEYRIIQFTTNKKCKCPPLLFQIQLKCYYGLDMHRVCGKENRRKNGEKRREKWMSFVTSRPSSRPFDACLGRWDWVISCSTDAMFKMTDWSLRRSTGIQGSESEVGTARCRAGVSQETSSEYSMFQEQQNFYPFGYLI